MAKKSVVKRAITQTKRGPEARYFQNGKRIPAAKGRTKWINQNYETLSNPWRKSQLPLLPAEQRSLRNVAAQKELFRYKGRPIKKTIVEVMTQKGFLDPSGPRELTAIRLPNGAQQWKSYGAFEQVFERLKEDFVKTFTTLQGAAGFRFRQSTVGIIKMQDALKPLKDDGWRFEVKDKKGRIVASGYASCLKYIMEYEVTQTEKLAKKDKSVAATSFSYEIQYDWKEKRITIDMKNTKPMTGNSDPSKRTPVKPVKEKKITRKKTKTNRKRK